MTGPLFGMRVVELGSIGPTTHAAMWLGDMGADVVRVDRPPTTVEGVDTAKHLRRNKRSIQLDLKTEAGSQTLGRLISRADVVLEGFRPGVMERLGLGPEVCLEANPGLVYGRMTGWGQDGPLAERAGHDLNYLAVTGVLHAIGRRDERPAPPLNLIGDYGGGSMFLVAGVLAALWERERSGAGQVVDAAMVDGVSALAQVVWSKRATDAWNDERESNLIDGFAPFYDTYRCSDDRFIAVAALEPKFFSLVLQGLGLDGDAVPDQYDRAQWPVLRRRLEEAFRTATRAQWTERFGGTDACVSPVLDWGEACAHPHLEARGTLPEVGGVRQAAPSPRFSRTPAAAPATPRVGSSGREVWADWADARQARTPD